MSRPRPAGGLLVDDLYAVGLLRGMLEIPSPSFHEQRLAGFLVDAMRDLGLTAHVDPAGNAIGELGRGPGPVVMMIGHLDTVPGEVPVRSEAGRLYGRGAADAKGPLAAMVCAAASATRFGGRLVVVGAVEEETPGSRGAVAIRGTFGKPDALIVGEPSGWSTVVLGYRGKLDLCYRVECAATHPSNPVPKATDWVYRAWTAALETLGPDAGHESFDRPGVTVTGITGDIASAAAEFSIRTPPGFDDQGFVTALRRRLPVGTLEVVHSVAACRVGRSDPVVSALAQGIREADARPTYKVKTATSDMNTLAEVWDLPMATYGPGDSRLDHADDENIEIAEYIRGIGVLTTALNRLGDPGTGGIGRARATTRLVLKS